MSLVEVQQTSAVILGILLIIIKLMDVDNRSTVVLGMILLGFFGSLVVLAISTAIRIWS